MKKCEVILLSAIIIASLLLAGCGNKVKPGSADVKRPIISGTIMADVKASTVDEYNETAGTIKAKNTSVIASQVMGTITGILVKEGDRVTSGQTLVTIDGRDSAARVNSAGASYWEAMKALEMSEQNHVLASKTTARYQQLYQDGAISLQQMDQVATQGKVSELDFQRNGEAVKRAQASLVEAQAYYAFTQIVAPTTGVITAKKVDVGSMAVPGVTLLVLEDNSAYTLEADIDESIAGKIGLGMTTDIRVDSLGKSLQGKITEIAPAIDPTVRKFHIKIDVSGEGLKSGLYAQLRIPTNKKEIIVVDKTAIVEKGQLTGVYVVDDKGLIIYRIVHAGREYDKQVEILSGIHVGEKIIIGGLEKVVDGGVVKEVTGP